MEVRQWAKDVAAVNGKGRRRRRTGGDGGDNMHGSSGESGESTRAPVVTQEAKAVTMNGRSKVA